MGAARTERTTRRGGRRDVVPFHTPVRGHRYAPRPPGAGQPRTGQRVGLLREREHPRDPWAVAVWVRAEDGTPWRLGYLERAVAARIGPRIDAGERLVAEVAGWTPEPGGRWWRPVIEVAADRPAARVRQGPAWRPAPTAERRSGRTPRSRTDDQATKTA